uniref:Uncharacterized protein n=1 Tax=Cannabis sativa TaxID=3483 RepID=A0A803NML4_CANSA
KGHCKAQCPKLVDRALQQQIYQSKPPHMEQFQKFLATQPNVMSVSTLVGQTPTGTSDGTPIPLAGIGSIFSSNLLLSNVYHILNHSLNLAYVSQLCDSDYSVNNPLFENDDLDFVLPTQKSDCRHVKKKSKFNVADNISLPKV